MRAVDASASQGAGGVEDVSEPRGARPVQEVLREMAAEERDVAALLRMDVDDQ